MYMEVHLYRSIYKQIYGNIAKQVDSTFHTFWLDHKK